MSVPTTLALVGTTGGAGTTRLAVELASALAEDGRDVAILDASFSTQGLSDYVSGALDADMTHLVTDEVDEPLSSGLVNLDIDAAGRVAVCAAAAPFERLARAMTPDAAQAFEGRISDAASRFDHVIVDTPPIASNPAVAAVTACERVALVAPDSVRGADAVSRVRARVADVGAEVDAVVSTFGALDDADVVIPESEYGEVTDAPATGEDDQLAAGVAAAASVLFETECSAITESGGVLSSVSDYVRR
ncbi:AAA family ATPase [Haloferax namakaokahaiae]|uniref:AAA family ATPase n=1 Tax=Haloferax namakaokahaiae TaxID=1748331 RepID=A0ABD5ZHU1_9EURY